MVFEIFTKISKCIPITHFTPFFENSKGTLQTIWRFGFRTSKYIQYMSVCWKNKFYFCFWVLRIVSNSNPAVGEGEINYEVEKDIKARENTRVALPWALFKLYTICDLTGKETKYERFSLNIYPRLLSTRQLKNFYSKLLASWFFMDIHLHITRVS